MIARNAFRFLSSEKNGDREAQVGSDARRTFVKVSTRGTLGGMHKWHENKITWQIDGSEWTELLIVDLILAQTPCTRTLLTPF